MRPPSPCVSYSEVAWWGKGTHRLQALLLLLGGRGSGHHLPLKPLQLRPQQRSFAARLTSAGWALWQRRRRCPGAVQRHILKAVGGTDKGQSSRCCGFLGRATCCSRSVRDMRCPCTGRKAGCRLR